MYKTDHVIFLTSKIIKYKYLVEPNCHLYVSELNIQTKNNNNNKVKKAKKGKRFLLGLIE